MGNGAIEFYEAARKAGIEPILGVEACEGARRDTDRDPRLDSSSFHLMLLARNNEGHRNLIRVLTCAHLGGLYYRPRMDRDLLASHSRGLVGLSGCVQGEIPERILAGDPAGAWDRCADRGDQRRALHLAARRGSPRCGDVRADEQGTARPEPARTGPDADDGNGDDWDLPIPRPASVDPEWRAKIRRARQAWEMGRRMRKDHPVSPLGPRGF
jgi:hypothetical protein